MKLIVINFQQYVTNRVSMVSVHHPTPALVSRIGQVDTVKQVRTLHCYKIEIIDWKIIDIDIY